MIRTGLSFIILLAFTFSASADWTIKAQNSEFQDSVYMAVVENDGYALAVRCKGTKRMLSFAFPQNVSAKAANTFNFSFPKLNIRVDGGPILQEWTNITAGEKYRKGHSMTNSPLTLDTLKALMGAQSRIAVSIGVNGKIVHETSFTAKGALEAVQSLAAHCNKATGPS
ncbi:hypothetical protein GCM10007301_12910 [Azorhizobium oxalatiphilum]|uniref:Uncharacterized protein n=1 Tax=Azorhizobium oxalatiphilum TaxID=980631 RepID=A0A917BRH6_9HYPH|nr:hypothetical protein [Azorhizobium oxalatiphilum]GGF54771.1 hypothetical protein GCM10007301_12910 [Azorhizobium oxalatiphilum]